MDDNLPESKITEFSVALNDFMDVLVDELWNTFTPLFLIAE